MNHLSLPLVLLVFLVLLSAKKGVADADLVLFAIAHTSSISGYDRRMLPQETRTHYTSNG